jgi:hypothetical protein
LQNPVEERGVTKREHWIPILLVVFLASMVVIGNYVIIPGLTPEIEWSHTYSAPQYGWPISAQQTSDGGFVIIGTTSTYNSSAEALLLKTDENGNQLWNKTYAFGWGEAEVVEQTSDSGYILAGWKALANNSAYSWLLKTDSEGNLQWNKTYSGALGGPPCSLRQTLDGGYIVAGYSFQNATSEDIWLLKIDSQGNTKWNTTYIRTNGLYCCVQKTSDGGYILVGGTSLYNASNGGVPLCDVLLIKVDSNGRTQWNRTYGGPDEEDLPSSVVETSDGEYAIAAQRFSYSASSSGIWLIKTDLNGSIQWSKTYSGGPLGTLLFSIQKTDDGGYIKGAGTEVIRTDSNGSMVWIKSFQDLSGPVYQYSAFVVQQCVDESYMVAGVRFGLQLGNDTLWLAKIAPFPPAASIFAFLLWSVAIPLGFIGFLAVIEARRRTTGMN